jgi:formamidopyrimidine-DNA glycosylase
VPELPEVQALADDLTRRLSGRVVERVDLAEFSALKTFDPPLDALAGRAFAGVGRRGKFLLFDLDGLYLALHLSRGGWVKWVENMAPGRPKPGKGPLALRVRLEGGGGIDVTEAGTEKRLAVHVVADPLDVEHIASLGPEALALDRRALDRLLDAAGSSQIKGVLTDQRRVAGIGNAYSDEILHVARLSPFRAAAKLDGEERDRLLAAIEATLGTAMARNKGVAAADLKGEKKASMRVHGRTGEACPECGDKIREVSFASKSLQYCATCQTGGKPLADRRLSRLLK